MKSILLSILLLAGIPLSSCRNATWVPPDPQIVQQQQKRVTELESQLDGLRHTRDRWQTLCLCAGVGAIVLLILGTALGAKTRHDAHATY